MEETKTDEQAIAQRKERVKAWLKDPYNIAVILLIVAAFILRYHYYAFTNTQTLWHDESEYVSMAKHYALGLEYHLSPKRPFMFSGIISLFFLAGLSEAIIRFFMIVLPSTLLVFLVYLLGKEMYDKRVGIIAALLTCISWTLLFWTTRMQPDSFSMVFQVSAILFMWKYWKNNKISHAFYAGALASLGFAFKVSGLLVPGAFLLFIIIKDRLSMFKNKGYWIFLFAFILFQIPQAIYTYKVFGNPLAIFGTDYLTVVADETQPVNWAVAMQNINFYYFFTESILFYLFLLGVVLAMGIFLYLDVLFKDRHKLFNAGLFSILVFVLTSAYYIFWIKGTDDRWVFIWLPFMFMLIGDACMFIYKYVKPYSKLFAVAIVVTLLAYGVYSQVMHADGLIKNKLGSYSQVKDAAVWMKEHSGKDDIILSASYPQTVYYSERKVIAYSSPTMSDAMNNLTNFERFLQEARPKFMSVSVFESSGSPTAPHPTWLFEWIDANRNRLIPVQAYFADAAKQQAMLVVYQIEYNVTSQQTPEITPQVLPESDITQATNTTNKTSNQNKTTTNSASNATSNKTANSTV
jgi:hypothetical protein